MPENENDKIALPPVVVEAEQLPVEVATEILKAAKAPNEKALPQLNRIISQEIHRRESFQGPLPHPDHLARYKEILPGLEGRIVEQFEKEQSHRHSMERSILDLESRNTLIGLILGGIVSVMLIGGSIYCAIIGQPWVAAALVAASAVSLVPQLINGWRKKPAPPPPPPPSPNSRSKARKK